MPYVLMIRERGCSWAGRDPIAIIHSSREEAKSELIDYVRENWDAKMDEDPPDDDDGLIDQYFDHVLEEYVITEAAQTMSPGKTVSEP